MRSIALLAILSIAPAARALPKAVAAADLEEHLGARVPASLPFVDEKDARVTLGDYFRDGKPVLLVLAYYRCPMLCDLVLRGVADSVARQGLVLGRDFRALTVSFDPRDKPAAAALKQHGLLQAVNHPESAASWPFLVGAERDVRALADRVGFGYAYDASTDQYAHPACAIVLTPDGRVSRYLYGVKFRPIDVRLALDEAAGGRIGTITDRVLLTCFRYDPSQRRYGLYVSGALKGGAALVLLIVGGMLGALWLRERRSRA
ncbi:MAG TPA: SCO family protein [Polyangia bacterium]|nr:SCO family protein [Polyangia bacterium]